jgi:hypothetical protein
MMLQDEYVSDSDNEDQLQQRGLTRAMIVANERARRALIASDVADGRAATLSAIAAGLVAASAGVAAQVPCMHAVASTCGVA